ncbi:hypothetical protein CO151_06495 [bacterium CG_4_9_14_3_um_filter_65_15]|nr:MAG: hypothetical protein CO151_06495 [bacterium CG_4_9_14_3_um_filter_65_15]
MSEGAERAAVEYRRRDLAFELWNLRAVLPDAQQDDLLRIKARQDQDLAREREALAGLWSGNRDILVPGHRFFADHPELAQGITVSLHLGPYQLLAEPYLAAGLEPVIVLNEDARRSFQPQAENLCRRLGHSGHIEWASLGRRGFVRTMITALRRNKPVLVYLDGNTGTAGMRATRDQGMRYHLPGRAIRVRTGLARLACRLECPVHRVALYWDERGDLRWETEPTMRWSRHDDPGTVTRYLYDWCFTHIMRRPEQWRYWAMLRTASSCFRSAILDPAGVPAGLREDFQRAFGTCMEQSPGTVHLVLESDVEVWAGDVLVDLSRDRFYPASGLQDSDLDPLRDGQPTLADLASHHGRAWVDFHGLRLCLLGMARLGGS